MILEPKHLLPDPFLFLTNKVKTISYKEEERICFFLKNFHKERNLATLPPRNVPDCRKGPVKIDVLPRISPCCNAYFTASMVAPLEFIT